MDLAEIIQYSHKIKKVNIKNDNTNSQYTHVVIKIAINDKQDNEVIRFSMQEYSDWINHQSNENDYFLRIPNRLESTITLFIHYFPVALYDYLEDQHIFSIYDWTEMVDQHPISVEGNISHFTPISQYNNKTYLINDGYAFVDNNMFLINDNELHYKINNEWQMQKFTNENYQDGIIINNNTYHIRGNKLIVNGEKYQLDIDSNYYNYVLDNRDKLVVRSYLSGSFDKFKNPNYKNYTKLISDDDISNQTEQGFFPLSSKYRTSYRYITAPDINENPLSYWASTINKASAGCERANQGPYWQARINHKGLSPLISDTQDGEYLPINVYLNYEYLPSSTEYHQHYYGFEPEDLDYYKNIKFTVLDGENLPTVNSQFGTESTYRLINNGNPFDDSKTMTVNHYNEKLINLENGIPANCLWEKNKCDNYYIYTPNTNEGEKGKVSINVELNEGETYRLQYYMYIPSESIVEYNSCYVEVEHQDIFGNITKIDSISSNSRIKDLLLRQDKTLRDQWIYHEIDFVAEQNNRISIIGPQHTKNTKNIEIKKGTIHQKEDYECLIDDKIFFTRFKLIKMEEYSPTLKYAGTGLYLAEQDQWAFKSIEDMDYNQCENTDDSQKKEWITHINDDEDKWYKPQEPLPVPIKDVYIIFNDDFEIIYNKITSELTWTPYIQQCVFNMCAYNEYKDEELKWQTDDDIISLIYDSIESTQVKKIEDNVPIENYSFHNGVFYNFNNRLTVNNKTLSNDENNEIQGYYIVDESGTATTLEECLQYNPPYTVIYQIEEYTDGTYVEVYDTIHDLIRVPLNILSPDKQNFTVAIEVTDEKVEFYVDNKLIKNLTKMINLDISRTFLRIDPGASLTYKDIYLCHHVDYFTAPDKEGEGRFLLYRKQHKRFTTGINNYFTLRLQDSNGNSVIRGEVECSIYKQEYDADPNNGYTCELVKELGTKNVDETGTVTYKKLNFSRLEPSRENVNYYLKIKYTNVCYDKDITVYKKIFFEQEVRNMKAYINTLKTCNELECMCSLDYASDNEHCILKASSEYDTDTHQYELTQGETYNIRNADIDLPIHIDVNIYNQFNTEINEGYCELSINDEFVQSTIVDDRGLADFYIDFEDIYGEEDTNYHRYINDTHTIKIEYFNRYNETTNLLYFDLTYTQDFDTRPAIPLNLYSINPSDNTPTIIDNEYEVQKNDIFILNFDVDGINSINNDFIIDIYKLNNNGQYILKNQFNYSDTNTNIFLIGIDKYENRNKDVYKIITRSANGISGQYRRYTKNFTIKWID